MELDRRRGRLRVSRSEVVVSEVPGTKPDLRSERCSSIGTVHVCAKMSVPFLESCLSRFELGSAET